MAIRYSRHYRPEPTRVLNYKTPGGQTILFRDGVSTELCRNSEDESSVSGRTINSVQPSAIGEGMPLRPVLKMEQRSCCHAKPQSRKVCR